MNTDLFDPQSQAPIPAKPLTDLIGDEPESDPIPPPGRPVPFYPDNPYIGNTFSDRERQRLAKMIEGAGQEKLAERYRRCRKNILVLECKDHCKPNRRLSDGLVSPLFIAPETCKSRFCEPCARSFGLSWRRKVLPFVKSLDGRSRKRRLAHVVLTWENQPTFMDNQWIKAKFKEVAEFVKIFYYQKAKKSGEFITGAIAVMEQSPTGFFHVHLLAYGYYWPQETLSKVWKTITGDSYIVHISSAEKRGPVNALDELIKYIIKPVTNPAVLDVFHYTQAIKGRRRLHAWGIFYNCPDIRPPEQRGTCPFCGGSLKKIDEGPPDLMDDGTKWPAWAVRVALASSDIDDLPDRYKYLDN